MENGNLISAMALEHRLHPTRNRSGNERQNMWVGRSVPPDNVSSGPKLYLTTSFAANDEKSYQHDAISVLLKRNDEIAKNKVLHRKIVCLTAKHYDICMLPNTIYGIFYY